MFSYFINNAGEIGRKNIRQEVVIILLQHTTIVMRKMVKDGEGEMLGKVFVVALLNT